jgi:cadmium resistance protein CadD (predicted permease)
VDGGIVAEAAGLFALTNVDDLLLLSMYFGRDAGQPGAGRRIVAGQYLGFGSLLVLVGAIAYGATFLPEGVIAYLGLLPLAIGLKEAWGAWCERRDDDDEDDSEDKHPGHGILRVAIVTFVNGGDDIGAYVPVFARSGAAEIAVYIVVFLLLISVWCVAGRFLASHPAVVRVLDRWGDILESLVLIALGLVILVQGGAFGL